MRRSFVVLSLLASVAAFACGDPQAQSDAKKPVETPKLTEGQSRESREAHAKEAATDAGATAIKEDLDAGAEWQGPYAGALFMQTPIMSDMEWPRHEDEDAQTAKKRKDKDADPRDKVVRLGYIRRGAKVPVLPEAHKKSNCTEGWYELVAGGFVCGKYASIDLNHPRYKTGPHAPDMTAALPYQYGYNIKNGTPLYRQVPSREERLQYEPWLEKKKAAPRRDTDDTSAGNGVTTPLSPATASDIDLMDAGLTFASHRTREGAIDIGTDDSASAADAGIPWYSRDWDGGKPLVTLDELKGEGPMARRMVKGFYLALDKEVQNGNSKWWKTTGGMLAPFDRIWLQKPISDFHGVWMKDLPPMAKADAGADPSKAQLGFVLWVHAKKYTVTSDKKHVVPGDPMSRFQIVRLTGENAVVGGVRYLEMDDGFWMRENEGTRTEPGPPPPDLAPNEKWIDVNLERQSLVAFEGTTPVFATIVSTGRRNDDDKEKDHKTPPGTFRIREKHVAATMDGDVASDGPYSIEDVPWIMYFNGSYALHGAFWHGNWGHTQSHGCVNLSPLDAKTMFGWTEPRLPEGWHGVMATAEKPGTRVVVHGESPK